MKTSKYKWEGRERGRGRGEGREEGRKGREGRRKGVVGGVSNRCILSVEAAVFGYVVKRV